MDNMSVLLSIKGKFLDIFGSIGPVIVPAKEISDPQNLRITCRLNVKTVQDSDTSFMIFSVAETIVFILKRSEWSGTTCWFLP